MKRLFIALTIILFTLPCNANNMVDLTPFIQQEQQLTCNVKEFQLFYENLNTTIIEVNQNENWQVPPTNNLLTYTIMGSGAIVINHNYLYNKYKKCLPNDWKLYLKLNQNYIYNNRYFGTYNKNKSKNLIGWIKFCKKYPTFPLINFIKDVIIPSQLEDLIRFRDKYTILDL